MTIMLLIMTATLMAIGSLIYFAQRGIRVVFDESSVTIDYKRGLRYIIFGTGTIVLLLTISGIAIQIVRWVVVNPGIILGLIMGFSLPLTVYRQIREAIARDGDHD